MKQIAVKSQMIESIYFSQEDGQLRICFHNGEERRFAGVPEAEAVAICEAESPGRHYLENIRHKFRRLAA